MDPPLDPPPLPTAAAVPTTAANPTPTLLPAPNHPPYAEMITAAITALNEQDGSNKRAIANYIETHYSNLPPTHSALLTHHLKRLKTNAQLLLVKHSYKLPRSTPVPANGAASSDAATVSVKRRPGRPPKVKPENIQAAVPVFSAPAAQPAQNVAVAAGQVNGPVPVGPVRGRGRPPKRVGLKRGPGRPRKSVGMPTAGGGGVGRPKKNAMAAARVGEKPRGRPPKPINVAPVGGGISAVPVGGGGVGAPVLGKRRGRPPKVGGEAKKPRNLTTQPKKPRKLSGKPLGRPKKYTSESHLLVAYLDLKAKLDNLQSRIKQTATVIKPYLNNEAAVSALEELEMAAMANVNVPTNAQSQPQPQPQAENLPPQAQS